MRQNMNFNKYHVSRNLFDGTLLGGYFTNADFNRAGDESVYKSIKVFLPAGTYTFSWGKNVNVVRLIIDGNYSQPVYTDVSSHTITSTTDGYVGISFRDTTSSSTVWDESTPIMLNEGSTALPYEPYSSEVWHDTPHYIHNTSTDTITTLPAVIYPNDTTATVGLKGQTVQSSTPSPSSPVMSQGCGERTGNLIRCTNTTSTTGGNAVIKQTAGKSEIIIESRTATDADGSVQFEVLAELTAGTYTLSVDGIINRGARNLDRIFIRDKDNNVVVNNVLTGKPQQFTISEDVKITKLSIVFAAAAEYSNQVVRFMLNEGSTALPYEPYGYKLTVSSANTTTPVYLGEVETTRRIKKLVFDGTENWLTASGNFYLGTVAPDYMRGQNINYAVCSHYQSYPQTNAIGNVPDKSISFSYATNTQRLYCVDSTFNGNSTDFKSYLAAQYAAGTPVTVWYVLATPETAVVNEPLMKIGNYTDEVSGISIPVTTGGDTISVDTTIQPSEVTINYKGWHPAIVHERTNGVWT